jgi:hypothetical protein
MFIDTQLGLIPAPEEPNVAAAVNMALRWSANTVGAGRYKHRAAPAAKPHRNKHTNTPLQKSYPPTCTIGL